MTNLVAFLCGIAGTGLGLSVFRLRRELRASRQAFDTLATKAPIGIMWADAEGRCTFANDVWYDLSGLGPAETLGHAWSRAVHPDDLPGVMQKWEESVRDGRPYVAEVRLVRPDGGERTVLAGAAPIRDAAGRITGFIGTVLDITDRRDAERRAREQAALLESFVDNASAAIYVKDAAGRYLLANRRHIDLWPVMRDFKPGTTPFDWFPEEVAQAFLETDRRVFESGEVQTFEEVLPHDDGPHLYVSVKFPVRDEAGRTIAVGGVSTDVTELQEARRALADRERVLRTLIDVQEHEKQTLCHEFHDGLVQYAVGSKMLLESLRHGAIDDGVRPVVESVIEYLAKGIEDGRRVIRGIRPQVLDDLGLRAALDDLCAELRAAGIAVEARIDPAIDAVAPPLQTTIFRIVQESLTNARKHSGSASVRLGVVRDAGSVVVAVEDYGNGFDQGASGGPITVGRKAHRAPRAGHAGHAGHADEGGHGGQGLLGIRERVRLAGGCFELDTAPGCGTRLRAVLPVRYDDGDHHDDGAAPRRAEASSA